MGKKSNNSSNSNSSSSHSNNSSIPPPSPRKPSWKPFGTGGRSRSVESMAPLGQTSAPSPRSSSPPLTLATGSPSGSSRIPVSPYETTPKKAWEHNFRSFLSLRSKQPQSSFPEVPLPSMQQQRHSTTSSSSSGTGKPMKSSSSSSNNNNNENLDQSVRGGKFFQSIFGGSSNISKSSRRKTKSLNELDEPMRNGKDKKYSPGGGNVSSHTTEHRRVKSHQIVVEEDELDQRLRSGTAVPASPSQAQRQQQLPTGLRNQAHLLPPIPSQQQQRDPSQLLLAQAQQYDSFGPPFPGADQPSNHYPHQQQLPYQQLPYLPQSSAIYQQQYREPPQQQLQLQQQHTFHSRGPSGVSSVSVSPSSATTEIKKAFTEFHNSSRYARDATSAYLGDEPSTRDGDDYCSMYNSPGLVPQSKFGSGRSVSHGASISSGSGHSNRYTSSSLPTVDENVSIHKSMRMLRPFQLVDSWQTGRRYLIGPAALATCPLLQGITSLSLSSTNKSGGGTEEVQEKNQSLADANGHDPLVGNPPRLPPLFGCIVLGKALLSYVVQEPIQHHPQRWWSSCILVLRQNFLLEYDQQTGDILQGLPRGYAHLQHSQSYAHPDFLDALEMEFYVSPCAKADKRVLTIRLEEARGKRDNWIACLNRAAGLTVKDMYEFDDSAEVGRGRYATVYAARRRDNEQRGDSGSKYDCAVKVIDKKEFWRRVVKGRERADTIVREASVQATMTTKCPGIPAFIRLRGFLETSDHVVLEMELLEGMDLFQYVSTRGVLPEKEAALILRDILTVLDGMNRAGLAHRDIKPANCLMRMTGEDDFTKEASCVVKVADYGMATFIGLDGLVRGRCGTPGYVAPEIFSAGLHGGYSNKVDIFSAGVTLYVMLCGYEPFYGETDEELVAGNKACRFEFPANDWRNVSSEAKDLVKRMMEPNPERRFSAKQALAHPWIIRHAGNTHSSNVFGHSGVDALNDSRHNQAGSCIIS